MDVFLYGAAVLVTLLLSIFGWIALAFASLPGSSISHAWHARAIRGLFYTYPVTVLSAVFFLEKSGWGLLWCFAPGVPVVLVYLIFKVVGFINGSSGRRNF